MTEDGRRLFLAYNVRSYGVSPRAWLSPQLTGREIFTADYWSRITRLAEKGLFDAVFAGDSSQFLGFNRIDIDGVDRFVAWASVVPHTERIGVIVTASTTYNDPYRLAERLLSLDLLSDGRVSWNLVTTFAEDAAANFGLARHPERGLRYRRAEEFAEVVVGLWDSAGDGPAVAHRGENFTVSGRLPLPRSPQGRPPIIRASSSDEGRRLAGRLAAAVFDSALTVTEAQERYRKVKSDARDAGRDPADLAYLPGLRIVLASTTAEAKARVDELFTQDPITRSEHESWFGGLIGANVADLDPDKPIPATVLEAATAAATADRDHLRASTLRVLADGPQIPLSEHLLRTRYLSGGHGTFVGAPEHLADRMEHWFRSYAADGFVIAPDLVTETLPILVEEVVPLLQRRGIYKHEYAASTLAGHFRAAAGRLSEVSA
ncbi:FMN-dependent oxidoreductase, nitrilotriacetate monooxygenase family [Thermomonospora echinospora]|uniref:FMN-dependent oxidoreductase, nitrilotriacetate monooxygenase family n=1 Tax=Thermomonospora echinospora TaxID=1992 RepID=A0A1H6E0D0_9ACTN|nr:NtaA/DmoA family FMN-dependent monooxygenase [Thermomonospora echinospora]SEG90375.1 FMN-dependent oxidoreductase, nitrilotriacetate monooxygenase family [Thermomonospora echinospora]